MSKTNQDIIIKFNIQNKNLSVAKILGCDYLQVQLMLMLSCLFGNLLFKSTNSLLLLKALQENPSVSTNDVHMKYSVIK